MKVNKNKMKLDTLSFHRKMYERRLKRMKELEGLTEKEAIDEANNPEYFQRQSEPQPVHASRNGL